MAQTILWLTIFTAIIIAARYLGSAQVSLASGALNKRYAGRLAALLAAIAICIAGLVAAAATGGGRLAAIWAAAGGVAAAIAVSAFIRVGPGVRPRKALEFIAIGAMASVTGIAVITTFGIFLTLIFESVRFFQEVPIGDFLFGTIWSPQTAIRADQIASEGAFGVLPLITGTLLVTFIAMLVAAPVGLMAAIYLEYYAHRAARDALKLILELLAGVPTVVYGFFALLIVGPLVAKSAMATAALFGAEIDISTQNALAAGLVMGVMIIPFISSLSDDVMSAIPPTLKEGGLALGATKSETILTVLLPAAGPGLVGAFLLAISRAIGETMIVVMAASRSANLTFNPLERVTTFTVQIVSLLTGDQEFDSAKTLSAFALGLLLFLITLALNVVALLTVKQFRMRYE